MKALKDIARERIEAGDLSIRLYPADGVPTVAVRVNPNFDDDRTASQSHYYWPERNARCLCWQSKKNGICSHTVAVILWKGRIIPAGERRLRHIALIEQAEREYAPIRNAALVQERHARALAEMQGTAEERCLKRLPEIKRNADRVRQMWGVN